MDPTAFARQIEESLAGIPVEQAPAVDAQASIYLGRDTLHSAMLTLRDAPQCRFTFLAEVTAVDFWPREPRFEVVYMLVSIEHRARLRVKVRVHGTDARVPTVSDIWPAANWLEREVWDLFGIAFDGHPDPRRLLMPEDWEGHPLRKDYPVQIRKRPETAAPVQLTEEEFRANMQKDRLSR
jgi:NADH-quinone oxidoreductase subunit C